MLDKLTPQFLKSLDGWLLKNQPLIWRTRIHWVVFGSLVVHLLVFVGFLLYPLTTGNMPTGGISSFRMTVFALGCFALLFWGYKTTQIPIKSFRLKSILITVAIYWLGVFAVCSNVWVTSKAMDLKIAALVEDSILNADLEIIWKELDRPFDQDYFMINIIEQIDRYQVAKDFPVYGGGKKQGTFNDYTISNKLLHGFVTAAVYDKIVVILDAKEAVDWFYLGYNYNDLYWVFLVGLAVLPLLALVLSMSSLMTVVLVAFAHFLTCIGLAFAFDSGRVENVYLLFTLFVLALFTVVKLKHKSINWFGIYALALFPITTLFLLDAGVFRQYFYDLPYFKGHDILVTLICTTLVGIMAYLYYKKINQPQTV